MSKSYSIRELAEEFDVTTRTIRFYDEKTSLTLLVKGKTEFLVLWIERG